MTERWQFAATDILLRGWEGQMVAYDRRSGDTHCLDVVSSALVACLMETTVGTRYELRDAVARDIDAGAEIDTLLSGALRELERLDLVRRLPD